MCCALLCPTGCNLWFSSLADAASVAQLTALQELELSQCSGTSTKALLGLPRLKSLSLNRGSTVKSSDVLDLLKQQQQQQQLTKLVFGVDVSWRDISENDDEQGIIAWHCRLASYLTASSSLQHLDLSSVCLPSDVWQHLFPEGRARLMPQLRFLGMPDLWQGRSKYQLSVPQVHAMIRCCPSLHALEGYSRQLPLQPALSSLPHLTSLYATAPEDASAAQVVTALTALQRLCINHMRWSIDHASAVLLPLQQCSQLTRLACGRQGWTSTDQRVANNTTVSALAQLTGLVELDLWDAPMREEQLMSLTTLVRVTHLWFCDDGLSGAFWERARQAFNSPRSFSPRYVFEVKVRV